MPVKKANSKLKVANRKIKNKKIRTTETRKKSETQKKLSVSKKFSGSMAARKASILKVHAKAPRAKKETESHPSLRMNVYNLKGKVVEKVTLPKEIFDAPINNQLMSQAVRVYLANQRQGTVSTKTRGEVKGSSRKIQRQKGTGHARHGSIRAPIFVHGGVVFGPTPRDFSMKLPKKMKRASLFSALSSKYKDGEIKVLSGLEKIEPKTKIVFKTLKNLELPTKTKILLVTPDFDLDNVYKASRNIEGVKILRANMLNTYEVLDNKAILLMKASIEVLKKHFLA